MKILYLSCHSILEYDEVKMLHELGHEVFPAGAYVDPSKPHDDMRPPITGMTVDPDLLEEYGRLAPEGIDSRERLTKEFVDNFDTVIVMHLPAWIHKNWDVMKHKRVIWRTIGQSVAHTETGMKRYRDEGMEIVRYSPMESNIPGYIGEDATIRFYKDPSDYGPWTGQRKRVITFAQSMRARGDSCNFDAFNRATMGCDRHLFGKGNEGSVDFATGMVPFSQLQQEMRDNRVYFYTGTKPASYTLNFIEAFMTGIPIVAIGPNLGDMPGYTLYEVGNFISNGYNGFVSNDIQMLGMYVKTMLGNFETAAEMGARGRQMAISLFGKDKIYPQWKQYLGD